MRRLKKDQRNQKETKSEHYVTVHECLDGGLQRNGCHNGNIAI